MLASMNTLVFAGRDVIAPFQVEAYVPAAITPLSIVRAALTVVLDSIIVLV
jgi:hypothetical protein